MSMEQHHILAIENKNKFHDNLYDAESNVEFLADELDTRVDDIDDEIVSLQNQIDKLEIKKGIIQEHSEELREAESRIEQARKFVTDHTRDIND